jgi:hypothetical protein
MCRCGPECAATAAVRASCCRFAASAAGGAFGLHFSVQLAGVGVVAPADAGAVVDEFVAEAFCQLLNGAEVAQLVE